MNQHLPYRCVRALCETLETRRLLSAGDVDLSFGASGSVAVLAPNLFGLAMPLTQLPGGKFLLVAYQDTMRLNTDGSLDTSFGDAGHVISPTDWPIDVQVQDNGSFVLANGPGGQVLARFNADGSPDTSFGKNGKLNVAVDLADTFGGIDHIALQPDGKIIVSDGDTLRRLTAAGASDPTFNSFAVTYVDNDPSGRTPLVLTVQPADGKILLGATTTMNHGSAQFKLVRLNADGTVDTSFASNGYFDDADVDDVVALDSGKIVITNAVAGGKFGVLRLDADGQFDATFAAAQGDHVAKIAFGGTSGHQHLSIADDGKIYVYNEFDIARLSADGAADDSFGRVTTEGWDSAWQLGMFVFSVVPRAGGAAMVLTSSTMRGQRLFRLEGDAAPGGPISLSAGTLSVNGTSGNDLIDIFSYPLMTGSGSTLAVRIGGGFGRVFDNSDVTFIDMSANEGNDLIWERCTQPSTISGGDGDDKIMGGDGDDSISGNAGRDNIDGGKGNDRLAGNGSRDKLSGNLGDDRLYGGSSADWLDGGEGSDQLFGEGGNDRLSGGSGVDILQGNAGDDTFFAVDGAIDQIYGSRGNDTAMHDPDDVLVGIESETESA